MRARWLVIFLALPFLLRAQQKDTVTDASGRQILLSEIVIRKGMDAPGFIKRVQADTSFYKAFRNLRVLNYQQRNDVRMFDAKGNLLAGQQSRTRQWADKGCRLTIMEEEQHQGDFFTRSGEYRYYTAELYASLFFAFDTVCGEHNRVGDVALSVRGKSGIDKHKEQLKMLFFNPGADVPGIPLMGRKARIFDDAHADLYDFSIDIQEWKGKPAYLFSMTAKAGLRPAQEDKLVIDNMVTWFDPVSMEVLARSYDMSYSAGVYDFDVSFEVEISQSGSLRYPSLIRYRGSWDIPFRKRERGVFTSTIMGVSAN